MWVIELEKGNFLNWEKQLERTTTLLPEAGEYSSLEEAQAKVDEINAEVEDEEYCRVKNID
jgi:hypothetical protein